MEEQGTQQQAAGTEQQTGQGPATSSGTEQANPWTGYQWDGNVDSLPEPVAKVIRDARADAGKARTSAKQAAADEARQELAQQIGKAIGLVNDDQEQADPAQVAQQVTALTSENKALTVELAVWKAAKKAGANAQALTDSRSFLADVANLDPAGGDFTTKLGEAITKALADNPNYREAGQAPLRSGGEFTGGPGVSDREPATPAERLRRGYANQT